MAPPDKQRIRALLKEAVTVLCSNSLVYNQELCVEGLLGITLDQNEVLLINISETIYTPEPEPEPEPEPQVIYRQYSSPVGVAPPKKTARKSTTAPPRTLAVRKKESIEIARRKATAALVTKTLKDRVAARKSRKRGVASTSTAASSSNVIDLNNTDVVMQMQVENVSNEYEQTVEVPESPDVGDDVGTFPESRSLMDGESPEFDQVGSIGTIKMESVEYEEEEEVEEERDNDTSETWIPGKPDYDRARQHVAKSSKEYPGRGPKYSHDQLMEAYRAVKERGMSVRKAAEQYGIPNTTLFARVSGRVPLASGRTGPPTMFTTEEEQKLVHHLELMSLLGYGYILSEILRMATEYAECIGKRARKEGYLTAQWFNGFFKRWPDLNRFKLGSPSAVRAKCQDPQCIAKYYSELEGIVLKYGLANRPQAIYRLEEIGVLTEDLPRSVVGPARMCVEALKSPHTATVSLIGCGNAAGTLIPPYFVFKGKRMNDDLLEGATPGVAGTVSNSGWADSDIYHKYLKTHFRKFIQRDSPEDTVLVLYDGHKSRINISLIEWAKTKNIILFVLPPHTSHMLQSSNMDCHESFQKLYSTQCQTNITQQSGSAQVINRNNVCVMACHNYISALCAANLTTSFRQTGIYPFNPLIQITVQIVT